MVIYGANIVFHSDDTFEDNSWLGTGKMRLSVTGAGARFAAPYDWKRREEDWLRGVG